MFTGRPTPTPGEPLFLQEDTDIAVALAEEEKDTCPSCGLPKAWCRDPKNQFAFEPHEDVCWSTKRLAEHREGQAKNTNKAESTKQATQISARFREGITPDLEAGLGLAEVEVDELPAA